MVTYDGDAEHVLRTEYDPWSVHLVTGWCEGCRWASPDSARPDVVAAEFEQAHSK